MRREKAGRKGGSKAGRQGRGKEEVGRDRRRNEEGGEGREEVAHK